MESRVDRVDRVDVVGPQCGWRDEGGDVEMLASIFDVGQRTPFFEDSLSRTIRSELSRQPPNANTRNCNVKRNA